MGSPSTLPVLEGGQLGAEITMAEAWCAEASRCRRGGAARWGLSLGGRTVRADNGRPASYRCAQAARPPARRFLSATPRPPGQARPAERPVGRQPQRHARPSPRGQRGDVCTRESGNGAPVGAPLCGSRPIVRRAHIHTR
jgi:hypothetical protein